MKIQKVSARAIVQGVIQCFSKGVLSSTASSFSPWTTPWSATTTSSTTEELFFPRFKASSIVSGSGLQEHVFKLKSNPYITKIPNKSLEESSWQNFGHLPNVSGRRRGTRTPPSTERPPMMRKGKGCQSLPSVAIWGATIPPIRPKRELAPIALPLCEIGSDGFVRRTDYFRSNIERVPIFLALFLLETFQRCRQRQV